MVTNAVPARNRDGQKSKKSGGRKDVFTTEIKLRGENRKHSGSSARPNSSNFKQIISKLSPETQDKVLIARADEKIDVEPHQTLAKVIQHNSETSPYVRTVVIQNTPQAFKAFGVKNVPKRIVEGWERYKRRSFDGKSLKAESKTVTKSDKVKHEDADEYIDAVFE